MHRLYLLPQRLFVVALAGALLFTIVPAQASTTLNEMRVAYREADQLLNQKKVNSWLKRKAALKQYPLYHYLVLKEVRATHTQYSDSQIDRIISRGRCAVAEWVQPLVVKSNFESQGLESGSEIFCRIKKHRNAMCICSCYAAKQAEGTGITLC